MLRAFGDRRWCVCCASNACLFCQLHWSRFEMPTERIERNGTWKRRWNGREAEDEQGERRRTKTFFSATIFIYLCSAIKSMFSEIMHCRFSTHRFPLFFFDFLHPLEPDSGRHCPIGRTRPIVNEFVFRKENSRSLFDYCGQQAVSVAGEERLLLANWNNEPRCLLLIGNGIRTFKEGQCFG